MSVYNGEKYLKEAIDSILNQTFVDFEFLIVNDCSVDDSRKILESYNDDRIKIIDNQKNIGLTKSLNKAINFANGKYIVRMDADDISLPHRLETQVKFMEEYSNIGISGSARIVKRESKKFVYNNKFSKPKDIKAHLLFGNCLAHPTIIMRKELLDKYMLRYNEEYKYAQDYELWCRAILCFDMANLSEPLLIYREHNEQIAKTKLQEQDKYAKKIRDNLSSKIKLWEKVFLYFRYYWRKYV